MKVRRFEGPGCVLRTQQSRRIGLPTVSAVTEDGVLGMIIAGKRPEGTAQA